MGNTGGVLTKGAIQLLYNEGLMPKHVGIYWDQIEEVPKVILKEAGVTFPLNDTFKYDVYCGNKGAYHGILVTLEAECPCEECDYEYGFTVISKWQQPGTNNSDVPQRSNFYGGKLKKITCTAGKIDDVHLLAMEADIIQQINNYKPYNTNNISPAQYASRYYRITVERNAGVVTIAGNSYTDATNGGQSVVEQINGANIGITAIYLSDPTQATYECALFSTQLYNGNAAIFTASVTPGGLTAIEQRSIVLLNRDVDPTIYSVEIDKSVGTVEGVNIARLVNNGLTTSYFVQFVSPDGIDEYYVDTDCKVGDVPFNFAANEYDEASNSEWQLTDINGDSSVIYAYIGNDYTGAFIYAFEPSAYDLQIATQTGAFALLPNDKVFEIFKGQPNRGMLAQFTWAQQPLRGVQYCKISLEYEQVIADLVGANHLNTRRAHIEIYVPQATLCKPWFNGNDLMGDAVVGQGGGGIALDEFFEAGMELDGQGGYGH